MKHRPNQGFLSSRTAIIIVIIILLAAILFIRNQKQEKHKPTEADADMQVPHTETLSFSLTGMEIPTKRAGDQIISHTGYTLSYNEKHEVANWVAYKLTEQQANSSLYERTNHFMKDPKVPTGTADDGDYQGSGYDRGHLAPAEDMAWSSTAMEESFYYSNMAQQLPAFNRGVWRRLEELTRFWAGNYDSIFIVTGPVLTGSLPTIGRVSIPQYFYKVVLEYSNHEVKTIGFVLPNRASSATLKSFAVPVESVEKLTGLDFFPRLPDDVEHATESDPVVSEWQWTREKAQK